MSDRTAIAAFVIAFACASAPAYAAGTSATAFLKAVNTNGDKTISKPEIESYAKQRFAAFEKDKDKTLDTKELKGRMSAAGLSRADVDKDKTLDESEFVNLADKLFDQANKKGDKTLSVAELETPAGQRLIALLH